MGLLFISQPRRQNGCRSRNIDNAELKLIRCFVRTFPGQRRGVPTREGLGSVIRNLGTRKVRSSKSPERGSFLSETSPQ
ncbi:hypothetical protein ACVIN2_004855 [Bradyrhizobium sp. USDA 3650]